MNLFFYLFLTKSFIICSIVAFIEPESVIIDKNQSGSRSDNSSCNEQYKSPTFGSIQNDQINFSISFIIGSNVKLTHIRIYYERYLHGMLFIYSDNSFRLIGYKKRQYTEISVLNKKIQIVRVKSGALLDTIQFCYTSADCTREIGVNSDGGYTEFNLASLSEARNFEITGFSGAFIEKYFGKVYNVINLFTILYEEITENINENVTDALSSCEIEIKNLKQNDIFNHKLILFNGIIRNESKRIERVRNLNVTNFSAKSYSLKIETQFPINVYNEFKGLIKLENGKNNITFSYDMSLYGGGSCMLTMNLEYIEDLTAEPLHLVIVASKNSKMVYDAEPGEINNINSAIQKFRVMAWLWQAFTDDQMYKNGFGHRSFRLDETERVAGEIYPKVHLVRSRLTTSEIWNIPLNGSILDMCWQAVLSSQLKTKFNKPLHFACLLLDSHKFPNQSKVFGHDARATEVNNDYSIATFGSHLLYSQPVSLREIKIKFSDNRKINLFYTSDDVGAVYRREAANLGIGSFLYQIGRSFGLVPNYGIMNGGYVEINRAFYSVQVNMEKQWVSIKVGEDDSEVTWSKVDCILMSIHRLFRSKTDDIQNDENRNLQVFATSKYKFTLYAPANVSLVAFWSKQDARYEYFVYYPEAGITRALIDMKSSDNLMSFENSNKTITLIIALRNGQLFKYENIIKRISSMVYGTKFKSLEFGTNLNNQTEFTIDLLFNNTITLKSLRVFHDRYVHGMEFVYSDNTVRSVGFKTGQKSSIDMLYNEIRVLRVKSGAWLDAIQFCFSLNDCTQQFGDSSGGTLSEFNVDMIDENPNKYKITGFSGASIIKYAERTINVINVISVIYERDIEVEN